LWASEEGKKELLKKGSKWTEDELVGIQIVLDSLKSITWNICNNAGIPGDEVISKLLSSKKGKGFNAKTKKYVDLTKDGILDSAKAMRVSLENAISAASMILLTDCAITDEVEEETLCKL
jgi:chaperonin GroEL